MIGLILAVSVGLGCGLGLLVRYRRHEQREQRRLRTLQQMQVNNASAAVEVMRSRTSRIREIVAEMERSGSGPFVALDRFRRNLGEAESLLNSHERALASACRRLGVSLPLPDLEPFSICPKCGDIGAHLALRVEAGCFWMRQCVGCGEEYKEAVWTMRIGS